MPQWTIVYVWMFWPVLLSAAAAAGRWGGPPERLAAVSYLAAAIAETVVRAPMTHAYRNVDFGVAGVDLCLLIALLTILNRHERKWLYAAAALQFVVFTAHVAKLIVPTMSRLAYAIMSGSGGYPSLVLLSIGTITYQLTTRRSHHSLPGAGGAPRQPLTSGEHCGSDNRVQ